MKQRTIVILAVLGVLLVAAVLGLTLDLSGVAEVADLAEE